MNQAKKRRQTPTKKPAKENSALGTLLKKPHVRGALLAFSVLYAGLQSYLLWSSFVSVTTSILTALVIAAIYSICFFISHQVRCATVIFFFQIFSYFGLWILHILATWILLAQPCLESIVHGNYIIRMGICELNKNYSIGTTSYETELQSDPDLLFMTNLFGSMHYIGIVALSVIFLYSLLYECTITTKNDNDDSNRDNQQEESMTVIASKYFAVLTIGITSASGLLLEGMVQLLQITIEKEHDLRCRLFDHLPQLTSSFLMVYLFTCTILAVFALVSNKILKMRMAIIKKFFVTPVTTSQSSAHFLKAKKRRPKRKLNKSSDLYENEGNDDLYYNDQSNNDSTEESDSPWEVELQQRNNHDRLNERRDARSLYQSRNAEGRPPRSVRSVRSDRHSNYHGSHRYNVTRAEVINHPPPSSTGWSSPGSIDSFQSCFTKAV